MTAATLVLPSVFRRERAVKWSLMGTTREGGPSAAGTIDVGRLDGGGFWRVEFSDIAVLSAQDQRQWESMEVLLDNGAAQAVVPDCAARRLAPWPVVDGAPLYSYDSIPHSNGEFFSDGTGYHQSTISAVTVGAAAFRATTLRIRIVQGSALQGGEKFTLVHPGKQHRRYAISRAWLRDDGDFDVEFLPPLREAVADASAVEFADVACLMRLERPDMGLPLSLRRTARASVAFVEA